jgi:kinesin family protein 18/19
LPDPVDAPFKEIGNSSSLNRRSLEGSFIGSPERDEQWRPGKEEAIEIKTAMRRISNSHQAPANPANRAHRRRSPSASMSSSPINENAMFTASQARRMVKSEKEHDARVSVLSPRSIPISKTTNRDRRTPSVDLRPRDVSGSARFSGTANQFGAGSRQASGTYR